VEHRHAKLEQSDRRKFDYVQYDNVQNIAAHVPYATEAKFDHLKAHAAEAHLFHNHDFGKVLVGQFGEMQRKKEAIRLLLLTSSNHAMSVELKVKDKDGKPHYVAALFDPNATTSHIRFASDELRTLEGLTLKGVIKAESTYKRYYPNSDEISIMFVRPLTPTQMQAEQARENRVAGAVKNRTLTSCVEGEQLSGTALFFMLENGFSGDIRRLTKEIAKRLQTEQLQLLKAERGDGVSGLHVALQYGHADAIVAFGQLLKELKVPLEDCVKLLAATRADNGIPGLHMALQYGHGDAIVAFGQVLKELKVPLKDCIKLLAATRADGYPGLSMALQDGHADAIEAFGRILKELKVSPTECAKLLEENDVNRVPGLCCALFNGHADAIATFGQVLMELQVPPKECAELLAAKFNGISGLSMALQNGHMEAAEQYIQIVKKISPELGDEHRAALLQETMKSHAT
jgi:hypothetical protein